MKRGFTLVELSIVLIIIGIIIGGIMVGKGLLSEAQNQAIISDFEKYQLAANNYSQKYRAWPGDDDDAESRWAAADPNVLNGNGDGQLPDPDSSLREYWQFWVHLVKAGFITGSYNGAIGSVPIASLEGFYITHWYDAAYPARQAFFLATIGQPNTSISVSGSPLPTSRRLIIDRKIDDGVLTTGNFRNCPISCYGVIYIYKN